MLYRHLLWGRARWARQALQHHDHWAGNETHWSFQESEDSLSESEDCGASGLAWDYSKGVSVSGCWKLGCPTPPWLTLITPFGWHCQPSLFAMASPSSPAIVDITCKCIFVSFIMRIKFVFWWRSTESRYKRHRISLQKYENCWKLANYAC